MFTIHGKLLSFVVLVLLKECRNNVCMLSSLQLFQEEVEEMNEPRNADTPFNANSLLPSLLAHAANGNNQSSSEFTKNTSLINATSRRSRSDDGLNTTLRAAPRAYLIRSCDNVIHGEHRPLNMPDAF
jgi:hypothetical protein